MDDSSENGGDIDRSDSHKSPSKSNSNDEKFLLKILKELSERLKEEYKYTDDQLIAAYSHENSKESVTISLSIFSSNLAASEALTKYLKETYNFNYHEISKLINRNERSVWASYQRAIKKMPNEFQFSVSVIVPISVFQNKKLSILECLIYYLKDVKHLKNKEIAELLDKNPSNVWTIYNRAKSKEVKR